MWRSVLILAALAALAPRARAGDDGPPKEPTPPVKEPPAPSKEPAPPEKPSWLDDDDGEVPEPPLVKAQAGIILWPYLRTTIEIDRKHSLEGKQIDAEDSAGLPERWLSPWGEASVGTSIRVAASWLDLDRQGDFTRAGQTIDVGGGRILANTGDFVSIGLHYSQVDAVAQWDFLRGKRYRIGVLGGARVIRIATRIAGMQLEKFDYQSIAVNDWLVSPIGGGGFELDPVPFFTFFANIRFIDWAWREIGLREERTFEMRVGVSVTFVEDMLSASLDFRFLNVFVNPNDLNGGRNLSQYEIDAGGIGLAVYFRY